MIFDELIADLKVLPNEATVKDKVYLFKYSVLANNTMDARINDIIETGQREDLYELMDLISITIRLELEEFANGEGIASELREWYIEYLEMSREKIN